MSSESHGGGGSQGGHSWATGEDLPFEIWEFHVKQHLSRGAILALTKTNWAFHSWLQPFIHRNCQLFDVEHAIRFLKPLKDNPALASEVFTLCISITDFPYIRRPRFIRYWDLLLPILRSMTKLRCLIIGFAHSDSAFLDRWRERIQRFGGVVFPPSLEKVHLIAQDWPEPNGTRFYRSNGSPVIQGPFAASTWPMNLSIFQGVNLSDIRIKSGSFDEGDCVTEYELDMGIEDSEFHASSVMGVDLCLQKVGPRWDNILPWYAKNHSDQRIFYFAADRGESRLAWLDADDDEEQAVEDAAYRKNKIFSQVSTFQ
ncbi:hypothetical protein Hypma_013720 [Hypsizygus marmoreus]|uniref:Uncharacterized protein n=1 Tax=Hypsizygus marmoreus TaxID=39966 RepID=A0A369JKF6_HYPMA|nr:hypothetical protein Hypma_013720 [Hypsizygus marmoreus]